MIDWFFHGILLRTFTFLIGVRCFCRFPFSMFPTCLFSAPVPWSCRTRLRTLPSYPCQIRNPSEIRKHLLFRYAEILAECAGYGPDSTTTLFKDIPVRFLSVIEVPPKNQLLFCSDIHRCLCTCFSGSIMRFHAAPAMASPPA